MPRSASIACAPSRYRRTRSASADKRRQVSHRVVVRKANAGGLLFWARVARKSGDDVHFAASTSFNEVASAAKRGTPCHQSGVAMVSLACLAAGRLSDSIRFSRGVGPVYNANAFIKHTEHPMTTERLSSSRPRAVIGLATAALLVAALLSSRVMAHHGQSSGMHMSTTSEQTSNFAMSGGLVPDRDPSVPEPAEGPGNSNDAAPTATRLGTAKSPS